MVRRLSLVALALAPLAAACGGGADNLPPPPPPPPPPPAASTPAATPTEAAPAEAPKPTAPPVTLAVGTASPEPQAPLPAVKILAPTANQQVAADKAGELAVKLDVKNWPTATGASHVHLILDNRPYKPIFDPKAPIKLIDLTGGEEITEGQHVLVAFPSRANHESVKTKGAIVVVPFCVGKKCDAKVDVKKPMLVYSRPKGDYKGETASHVLVDFQLLNTALGEGKEHVNVTVTGPGIDKELTAKVEKFGAPLYLDNLRNGAYELKVELRDAKDQPIAGPWNSTTRTIKIDRDATADNPHGDHASPAADAKTPGKDEKKDGKGEKKPAGKDDAATGPRTPEGAPMAPKK